MFPERRVKLKNGRNQALRIPRGFELRGNNAVMGKEGEKLIVEPVAARSLLGVLAKLTPIDEEFPEVSDPRPRAVEP